MLVNNPPVRRIKLLEEQDFLISQRILQEIRLVPENDLTYKGESLCKIASTYFDLVVMHQQNLSQLILSDVLSPTLLLSSTVFKPRCFSDLHPRSMSSQNFSQKSVCKAIKSMAALKHSMGSQKLFSMLDLKAVSKKILDSSGIPLLDETEEEFLNSIIESLLQALLRKIRLIHSDYEATSEELFVDENAALASICCEIVRLKTEIEVNRTHGAVSRLFILRFLLRYVCSFSLSSYLSVFGYKTFCLKTIEMLSIFKAACFASIETRQKVDERELERNLLCVFPLVCEGCDKSCNKQIVSAVSSNIAFSDLLHDIMLGDKDFNEVFESAKYKFIDSQNVRYFVTNNIVAELLEQSWNIITDSFEQKAPHFMPKALSHICIDSLTSSPTNALGCYNIIVKLPNILCPTSDDNKVNFLHFREAFLKLESYYFKASWFMNRDKQVISGFLNNLCESETLPNYTSQEIYRFLIYLIEHCRDLSHAHCMLRACSFVKRVLDKSLRTEDEIRMSSAVASLVCVSLFNNMIKHPLKLRDCFYVMISNAGMERPVEQQQALKRRHSDDADESTSKRR